MDAETPPGAADDPVEAADQGGSAPPTDGFDRPRSRRLFYGLGRSLIALIAATVLILAGYQWITLRHLNESIVRTNVFGATPSHSTGQAVPPLTSDVNILLVGVDSRTDPHGNPLPDNELAMLHAGPNDGEHNTDTMILIHIPAGGQRATAISFPRDSYVQLAGGYGEHKLNSAFAYAHNDAVERLRAQGLTDPAQIERLAATEGRKNLIASIEQLIGNTVTINRYAEVNLVGFYELSLAVGGVPVCINQATHDDFTGASFPAGEQVLSGVPALDFVRQRHGLPGGDLDRIIRQQTFIGALAKKMLSAGTLADHSKVSALIGAIQDSVTLSDGWDVTSFATQMQRLTSGAIQFATMPTNGGMQVADGDVLSVDPDQAQQFAANLFGLPPSGGPTTHPTPRPIDREMPSPTTTTTEPTTTTSIPQTTTSTATSTTTSTTPDGVRCVN